MSELPNKISDTDKMMLSLGLGGGSTIDTINQLIECIAEDRKNTSRIVDIIDRINNNLRKIIKIIRGMGY